MAIRKKAFKQDLQNLYDYLTIDEQPFSDGFFNVVQFPEKLKAGKNLFKIRTNTDIFVNDSRIYVEALDFNGVPIYVEPLNYIEKDDLLVVNNSKVIPAYFSVKFNSGHINVTLHKKIEDLLWRAFIKPGKKINSGDKITLDDKHFFKIIKKFTEGDFLIEMNEKLLNSGFWYNPESLFNFSLISFSEGILSTL